MEVHCSTCGEPWDCHHLFHDAIYDTGLSVAEADHWCELALKDKLAPRYRAEFKAAGYEFGATLMNVVRCPGCPKAAVPDPERVFLKGAMEELLGDDLDGLAATFNDHGL